MKVREITYYHKTPRMSFIRPWSTYLVNQPVIIPLNVLSSQYLTQTDKVVLGLLDSYLDFIPDYRVVNGVARVNVDILALTMHSNSAEISKSIHHIQHLEHQLSKKNGDGNDDYKQRNNLI